jgi:hypothetical protein
MFNCYLINGSKPTQGLAITDDFGSQANVALGKGKLICTPATATVVSGQLQPGDFSSATNITCYEVGGTNLKVNQQIVDPFVTETVKLGVTQYTCVQAFMCNVGESCGPGAP